MNTLYPIIRRKRRPLAVVDVPPVVAGKSVPDGPPSLVPPVAITPADPMVSDGQPHPSDDQTSAIAES